MCIFNCKECSDPANCANPGPTNVTEKNELVVVHGKDEGGEIFYYPVPEDNVLILGQEILILCFDFKIDLRQSCFGRGGGAREYDMCGGEIQAAALHKVEINYGCQIQITNETDISSWRFSPVFATDTRISGKYHASRFLGNGASMT